MMYLLLIYGNHETWSTLTPERTGAMMTAHDELQAELKSTGEFVTARELPVEGTKIVKKRGGEAIVTDGPFTETKEIVAGYYIVECDSIERASELAGRLVEAELALVEVRPIWEGEPTLGK